MEERRHTDLPDASKIDPSKWIPLPRSITRIQPALKRTSQPPRDEEKRRSVSNEPDETGTDKGGADKPKKHSLTKAVEGEKNDTPSPATYRQTAGRSHSADVGHVKNEKLLEERRHTECSDPRTIATRLTEHIFLVKKKPMP